MTAVARIMLFVAALAACADLAPEPEPSVWFDREHYETQVAPVLDARCANPSCHGRSDRPFALFGIYGMRLHPEDTHTEVPLRSAEVDANYTAACLFGAHEDDAVDTAALLRKPLARTAFHGGGAIFPSESASEYRTLRAWLLGEDN